jgi:PAS domain S-box-containing protein
MSETIAQLQRENQTMRRYLSNLGELALAGESPLDTLLQRIVETAKDLLNARYAALGVFDARGRVTQFFTAGMTTEERARIHPLPQGKGLLGLIAREQRIIRVASIVGHPSSVGFPPNHPSMVSFLGGPIMRGPTVYGNLYLTDRIDAPEFSASDEDLLALLAQQAAIAIENAQRFVRARRTESTTRALYEIGRALASLSNPDDVIDTVVREARHLLEADISGLVAREPGTSAFCWMLGDGIDSGPHERISVPLDTSLVGKVIRTGVAFEAEDIESIDDRGTINPILTQERVRALLVVPLKRDNQATAALVVGWRRPGAIPDEARDVLERLADRASIAMAQAELHAREEDALRQSQIERASLEAIFDSMHDAVFTTDLEGRIVRINRRASVWAGRTTAEAIGRPADEVFPLVDDLGHKIPTVGEQSVEAGDIHLLRPSGERIPIERVASPIRGADGQHIGTVEVLRDLRPQREVEQLKATIVSLVSHELRTPLSHIKGYASSLLQPDVEWDAETQRDFIASIERQADRLGRLISDLLEISRLDAGGAARLERVPINPAALVERGIRQSAPNAVGHPLTTSIPDGLPLVMADPGHIERVLSNLIENAAKYSPEGAPITVTVSAENNDVVFAIEDEGGGMTPEELSHLFERFYRSPRVKHRTPGTGLGLAICREIIHAHGGKIWAESDEGKGSTFRFTLPRVG